MLFVAMNAVNEDQTGVVATSRWPGYTDWDRVSVVAWKFNFVGFYVPRVINHP